MPKDFRKEITFQAGEISPLFYGRTETEFYAKGLAIARNVIVDKRGGIFRRPGMQNRGQHLDNDIRIFTKQVHKYRFDLIYIADEVYVIAPGAAYTSPNLIGTNPTFRNGIGGWSSAVTGDADVYGRDNVAVLIPEAGNASSNAEIRQACTVTGGTGNSHTVQVQKVGDDIITIDIGTTSGGSEIASFQTRSEFSEFTFVPGAATYWVNVSVNGDTAPNGTKLVFVGSILTANVGGLGQLLTTQYLPRQVQDIHTVYAPDGEAIYLLHPNVAPNKITYDFATDAYTFATVSFTSPPAEWTLVNYPATGAYFKGRLWLAATPDQPQTVWASVAASPENFTTGALAADSWNFTLEQQGRIKWLNGRNKTLIIGAENAEHIMTSEDNLFTQLDFSIDQQSAFGSNGTQAIPVGDKLFYFTPDGRKIQSMAYAWQEDNWLSQDLSFASEHITAGIARYRAWAQNPDAHFYIALESGDIAVLTYDRTSETLGWSLLEFEGMTVVDVAVGTIGGLSRLVTAGFRTFGEMEIEIEGPTEVYLDSYAEVFHATASDALSGLDHLEGEEVQVVVDGAVSTPQTVSSGAITASETGNVIRAGKQIYSRVTTLPPDVPNTQILSWKKRWNQIWVLLYESATPIINGTRGPDRTPTTPMDTPEPFTNKAVRATAFGWDENGQVTVEEDQPVPLKMLAIYGEMARESL